MDISEYYAKYEKEWTDYINFKEYRPLQFKIEKNPNFKVRIDNNNLDLRLLLKIKKVKDNKNDMPYLICSFNKTYAEICSKYESSKIESDEEWCHYFFAAHTEAEYYAQNDVNTSFELKLGQRLKKLFIRGMDVSSVLPVEKKISDKNKENLYNPGQWTLYEQWAVDVIKEYIERFNEKTEEQQKEFREWMLQSILSLHTFFSYQVRKQLKNELKPEDFTKYLGVSEAELDALLNVVWKREVILNDAVTLEDRVRRIKEVCDVKIRKNKTFTDFAYDKETKKKWKIVCQYVLNSEESLVRDEQYKELARFVLHLKRTPNKAIAEVIFKPFPKSKSEKTENTEMEYSLLAASPELAVSIVDKEIYKTQKNLRIAITNVERPRNVLKRMPAFITNVEVTVSWKNKENEIKTVMISTLEEYDKIPLKLAGGKSKEINLSLEELKKEDIWEDEEKELSLTVSVTYTDFLANEEKKSILFPRKGKMNIGIAKESWEKIQEKLNDNVGGVGNNKYFSDKMNDEIFFGRKSEIKQIADWILRDVKHFCISGQKQCGKSSLSGYIFDGEKNKIKENILFENNKFNTKIPESYTDILVLSYDTITGMCGEDINSKNVVSRMMGAIVNSLRQFVESNYEKKKDEPLFAELMQKYKTFSLDATQIEQLIQVLPNEVKEKINIDVLASKEKYQGGELRLFSRLADMSEMTDNDFDDWMKKFNSFMELNEKKYKIIVVIDEFTTLCTRIIKYEKEAGRVALAGILEKVLINGFYSPKGVNNIYVLAIGHEAMRLQLENILDLHNGIIKQDFILLLDLTDNDVKDLICKAFDLGEQKKLFDLFTPGAFCKVMEVSGGNAPIVKLILNRLYSKFYSGEFGYCITELDIDLVIREYVKYLTGMFGKGEARKIFNPFLEENKNEKVLNEAILNYLTEVSNIIKVKGYCKRADVIENTKYSRLGEDKEQFVYDILVDRNVLRFDEEEIKVNVGLLVEYLYLKNKK